MMMTSQLRHRYSVRKQEKQKNAHTGSVVSITTRNLS